MVFWEDFNRGVCIFERKREASLLYLTKRLEEGRSKSREGLPKKGRNIRYLQLTKIRAYLKLISGKKSCSSMHNFRRYGPPGHTSGETQVMYIKRSRNSGSSWSNWSHLLPSVFEISRQVCFFRRIKSSFKASCADLQRKLSAFERFSINVLFLSPHPFQHLQVNSPIYLWRGNYNNAKFAGIKHTSSINLLESDTIIFIFEAVIFRGLFLICNRCVLIDQALFPLVIS